MCGRIVQASGPLQLAIVKGLEVREDSRSNAPRHCNGAPSQELLVIRENHKTGERSRAEVGSHPKLVRGR